MSEQAKPKILCVDDESSVLAALTRLLSNDFIVLSATSTQQAKDLLDHHRDVAVVLTDHRMPGVSGLSFLEYVQASSPDSVRALLSGFVDLNEVMGAINTGRVHRLILKPWENDYLRVQMTEALAAHSTLREKRELEQLSITDPVTHLRNHRFFQDHLKIEVERSVRYSRPVSLIMIDVDHFKKYNDQFGHPAGDRLLRTLAQKFLGDVRTLDTVARYGGEEFAIIMPDTNHEGALVVAERVRQTVEQTTINFADGRSTFVTVSLGVATAPEHGRTAEQLIEQADSALYRAKGQGRNQSVGA